MGRAPGRCQACPWAARARGGATIGFTPWGGRRLIPPLPMNTRRDFFRSAALGLATATAAPRLLADLAPTPAVPVGRRAGAGAAQVAFERLATLRHDVFEVRDGPTPGVQLVLREVTRHERGAGIDNFSLHFVAGTAAALPQGTYVLHHATAGDFEFFLVPGGNDPAGQACWDVVVNRLV